MTLVIIPGIDLASCSILGVCASSSHPQHPPRLVGVGAIPLVSWRAHLRAALGGMVAPSAAAFIATLAVMVFAPRLGEVGVGGQKISSGVLNPDGSYKYVDLPRIFSASTTRSLGRTCAVVTLNLLACIGLCRVYSPSSAGAGTSTRPAARGARGCRASDPGRELLAYG